MCLFEQEKMRQSLLLAFNPARQQLSSCAYINLKSVAKNPEIE